MNDSQFQNKQSEKLGGLADILIVDDVPDNIRFLSNFLSEQGYQVRKATNGKMALRAINTLTPDLILLDKNLPDMNGYEICCQLKQDQLTAIIPIIFLSAGNEAIDKVKAFQLGAADYITKPFYLEEVLVRIQTQLTIQGLQKELKTQNNQLKQALEELKVAQANLVQQEKMAMLRKVVAGVAHEVNNPLSFIACNIRPAKDYINQLLNLIKLYQEKSRDSDPDIKAYLEEMDLEFLVSDLTKILNSIGNGAERIRTVVLALRIFSRLDESAIKDIDLQESIEQILTMLQHRFSREDQVSIHLKKEYKTLPLVTSYPDQLNQVIFNLLCNAIDAIEDKINQNGYGHDVPEISIRTELTTPNRVSIYIKDNGIGIPEANQPYIFEPFFTTKLAGRGVGLGLATSQRIIEEIHGGSLTYRSTANEGTEFMIQLPISMGSASM
jgi:signal transduction histidine kinase